MLYESFLIIFELLEPLGPPGECSNIDFEAYQKIEVLVIFFALPDNFGARFTLGCSKDLEPKLCMWFSF